MVDLEALDAGYITLLAAVKNPSHEQQIGRRTPRLGMGS
jgi:hypothetical protein